MKNRTQVVILCGGKGTRIKEETVSKPKPMIEIGGKPILWHIMKSYSNHGFNRFILALGYKENKIKEYFYNYQFMLHDFTINTNPEVGAKFYNEEEVDWEVTCVNTGDDTLKGGRVKRIERYIDTDCFHLTYGDGVSNVNISELHKFHCENDLIGTVTAVRPPSRFGELDLDADRVVSFREKPQLSSGFINGGYFVFKRDFLDYLTIDKECDLEFSALQNLAEKKQLLAYKHDGFWQCMDNVRERDYLNKLMESNNAPWLNNVY
jgi:glucose-1-phosphate cytidylyltransferase